MSDSPVQDLIDQLKLMRVELGDLKKRQVSEERLTHLQAALEDSAEQIAGVRQAAAIGGAEGAVRIRDSVERSTIEMVGKINDTLSYVQREASDAVLTRRRYVTILGIFSALTGLATGALLSLLVYDHYLERDFKDSIQLMGWDWSCTRHDGFISDQDNGKFCVFRIVQ